MVPFSQTVPKYGSQRSPRLRVIRSVALHASWPYTPMYNWWFVLTFGELAPKLDIRPVRKSASARPVTVPLKVKVPLDPA